MRQDFAPKGTAGVFQRGQWYDKYVYVKKGSTAGVSTVRQLTDFSTMGLSQKELKHEQLSKYHWRGPSAGDTLCFPDHDLCPTLLPGVNVITAKYPNLQQ